MDSVYGENRFRGYERGGEVIQQAFNIKTEYLKNPLGIDIENPRVMWNCEGGVTQTAYQIVTDDWDSGKIESSSMRIVVPVKFEKAKRVNLLN